MSSERVILLVVHTGRDEATETARRVEKVLSDNGIGLRVLSAEAVDRGSVHLDPRDLRDPGRRHRGRRRRRARRRGLRTGAGARRRRNLPAGRRTGPQRRDPGARRQPGPHRLPGRGRGRSHRRRPRPRHLPRLPRRGAHDAGHRRPGGRAGGRRAGGRSTRPAWRRARGSACIERRPRDRRPAGLGVRLRRCAGVEPDRLHRLRVLRGRTGGLARPGGNPGGAQQRSRAVRPPDGHQPATRRSPSRSTATATTHWCCATGAARCGCPPAAAWR